MLHLRIPFALLLALMLAGCSTTRETQPERTATEQLLLSTAVDDALEDLRLEIPPGTRLWVDARNFEGYDSDYAVSAIRDHLLRQGARLVADRSNADAIVEIRSGALSTDKNDMLVGIPSIELPVPLTESARTPEIAIVKKDAVRGVAKIGFTIYERESGALAPYSPADPAYGFSDRTRWIVLSLIGWTTTNVLPEDAGERPTPPRRSRNGRP